MKKNKTITLKKLIYKNLVIHIVIFFVCVWGVIGPLFSFALEKIVLPKGNFDTSIDIATISAETVDEAMLIEQSAQLFILDDKLETKEVYGTAIMPAQTFSSEDFSHIISNSDYTQDYYASLKVENSPMGDNLLLLVQRPPKIGPFNQFDKLVTVFVFLNFFLVILTFIVVMFLFVRSIYKPLKKNFNIIEENISKTPYDTSKVEIDNFNLIESREVLTSYNAMVDALETVNREKIEAVKLNDQLITNLAHDLKSPLTVLKGYTEVLLEGDEDEATKKKYLSYIGKSTNDLNDLTSLLFEQIKYKNGENMTFEKHDVNAVFREVCANYYIIFDKLGFEFTSDISEDPFVTSIDIVNIKRVFGNLLQNILSHNETPTKVLVSSYKKDGHFVIKIKDDGKGIQKENYEKVFDAFFGEDVSRNSKNSGIGLYVSRQIVEKHGGSIKLESENDYKTVFTITL